MGTDRLDRQKMEDAATTQQTVQCGICMREIPLSAAISRETTDYTRHFCGVECLDRWRHHREEAAQRHPRGKTGLDRD